MLEALEKSGADFKFSSYLDMKHDCWTTAYGNAEVYLWMLGCRRVIQGDDVVLPGRNKVVFA